MIQSLDQQLQAWEANDDIKAVIIKAAPGRAFCAGGDLRAVYENKEEDKDNLHQFFKDEYLLNTRIHEYTKPYISLLDGITMGGGVGISIHGSHRVATENFVFAMPETGIGFFPDVGGSYFLPRLPDHYGIYLALTGYRLYAPDTQASGISTHFIKSNELDTVINTLKETPLSDDAGKAITQCLKSLSSDPGDSTLQEQEPNIARYFSLDDVESIIQALKKGQDTWCADTATELSKRSPTSLKVAFEQIRRGKQLDFHQCMEMEYTLVQHFLKDHDIYEGVRALLVDKDNQPQWQPNSLSQVSENTVELYFTNNNTKRLS